MGQTQVVPEGLIILLAFICAIVPMLILTRHWILRNKAQTTASRISNLAVILFGIFKVAVSALVITDCAREMVIRKTTGQNGEVEALLLTQSYYKV
jgi:hypothetical protein